MKYGSVVNMFIVVTQTPSHSVISTEYTMMVKESSRSFSDWSNLVSLTPFQEAFGLESAEQFIDRG